MAGTTGATVRIVSNRLPQTADAYAAAAVAAVKEAAYAIEAAARAKAAVRTGTLRRSIHTLISDGGLKAVVGPSVEYSTFVEFGTRHMAARPYMRPAAELVYPKFIDHLKIALKRVG